MVISVKVDLRTRKRLLSTVIGIMSLKDRKSDTAKRTVNGLGSNRNVFQVSSLCYDLKVLKDKKLDYYLDLYCRDTDEIPLRIFLVKKMSYAVKIQFLSFT